MEVKNTIDTGSIALALLIILFWNTSSGIDIADAIVIYLTK